MRFQLILFNFFLLLLALWVILAVLSNSPSIELPDHLTTAVVTSVIKLDVDLIMPDNTTDEHHVEQLTSIHSPPHVSLHSAHALKRSQHVERHEPHEVLHKKENAQSSPSMSSEDYEKRVSDLTNQLNALNLKHGSEHGDIASVLYDLAVTHIEFGQYAEGLKIGDDAVLMLTNLNGSYHADIAKVTNGLASVLYKHRLFKQALHFFEQTLSINEVVHGENSKYVAVTLNNLGNVLTRLKVYDEAVERYKATLFLYDALATTEGSGDTYSQDIATTLSNLGIALYR